MHEPIDTTPAALYARVSSDRQDVDLSVAAQLRALRDCAERSGLRMGWPRITLVTGPAQFAESAERGHILARLLDNESNVDDLLDPGIAVPTRTDATQLQSADFNITIGLGHFGANQAVMPGQSKIERRGDMVDFYLNDRAHWKDVPAEVWGSRQGRYQALKRWLSYRVSKVQSRGIGVLEVTWCSEVVGRVAGTLNVSR